MALRRLPILFLLILLLGAHTALSQDTPEKEQDYAFALGLFKDKNYKLAFEQFTKFLDKYPDSDLRIDAEYYAGECLYQQAEFTDAAARFRTFTANHPKSKLADDAGFREGEI